MDITTIQGIHLGSGLIGIGRKWGYIDSPIPTEQEVAKFLSVATDLGISYFDTAASYGDSEERLGKFLTTLSSEKRNQLIVATKFGDHWNSEKQEAYVDHSYEALKNSLDNSLKFLKQIDLLYLHKAHMQALQSPDVIKAFEYAKAQGITRFAASISNIESAEFVLDSKLYSVIQLPYNADNPLFDGIIDKATARGKIVVINRPFNMGKNAGSKKEAFTFILRKNFNGFIITGTKSPTHLQENTTIFIEAKTNLG